MRAKEFITEQELDEIDRRGFLKALGGAALAGSMGVAGLAQADTSMGGVTQHDNGAVSYSAGPMHVQQNPDKSLEAEYKFYDNTVKAFQRGNVSGMSAAGPNKDQIINVTTAAKRQGIDTNSPRFQKFLQSLQGINEEDDTPVNPEKHPLVTAARMKHPLATSDEEALALYVHDQMKQTDNRERQDVTRIDRVNDVEDSDIDALKSLERKLDHEVDQLQARVNNLEKAVR